MDEHGWHVTHPTQQDAQAVLSLKRAFDLAVSGEPDTDLDDVHHDWSLINLEQDAWLVHSDSGEPLAYAAILPHQTQRLRIDISTAPDTIKSDLPGELLKLCFERSNKIAQEKGLHAIKHLVAYLLHSNLHYRKLFDQAGFQPMRHIYQLRIEMTSPPKIPKWPEGIEVRSFIPGEDDLATYEVIMDAFDRPERERYSLAIWRQHMLRPGSYRPELWQLAYSGDQLVGVCLGFDYPQEGWVRQLGVIQAWRRRGLGSALLQNAFVMFYDQGKRQVGLTTESDNPDALTFYTQLGMSIKRQYDEYIKMLSPVSVSAAK
jgi:ribosomal protein S18 acetylase RimI-like enzyme